MVLFALFLSDCGCSTLCLFLFSVDVIVDVLFVLFLCECFFYVYVSRFICWNYYFFLSSFLSVMMEEIRKLTSIDNNGNKPKMATALMIFNILNNNINNLC